ncbi:pyruvate kinase [Oleisolibacter albus]|uniref:pyruvate kinase n=1 Tax=Oleisolibacter albus TaxID=2171757 RepID=UPI000DF39C76|nr:pyruvate kinase [Oleisolibacter albus]
MREPIFRNRRTKIVATLGPASSSEEVIESLFRTGVDVFRLNFSHGSHEDHAARLASIRAIEAKYERPIGVLADIQGPKLRIGTFRSGHVILQKGQSLRLDMSPVPGDSTRVQLPHPEIMTAARVGTRLLLDDGKIRLRVTRCGEEHLDTEVLVGGRLSDRKGVNVPDVVLPIPALTAKDRLDVAFALELGVDYIGLSFVQRPEDIIEAREIVGDRAWILAKIEKPQALERFDEIAALTDAIMVARGDLGVELPAEEVPLAQKRIVRTARRLGKPVVVATQMLESMIQAPTPTRAEASDVATAVFDGADAVMLSAETAAGQFPLEAVDIMSRITARVEQDESWRVVTDASRARLERTTSNAIAAAACQIGEDIDAKAIVAYTHLGPTALRIARERPAIPVLSLTPFTATARRLAIVWGVEPVESPTVHSMTEAVARATAITRSTGHADGTGEIVVVAGVPFGRSGVTNALRVASIGRKRGNSRP